MTRWCIIGPTYPFRGGIAHYTTLLAEEVRKEHELLFISFKRQYPKWLYSGRSDQDPSQQILRSDAEYLLDPLNPLTWHKAMQRIGDFQPEMVIIPWWVPFWAPTWSYLGWRIKRLNGRPKLIFICHNVLPHERNLLDIAAIRMTLARGDGFITHSQSDSEQLLGQFPRAKVKVSPIPTYAPLLESQDAELPAEIPADRPLLLFCGFVRPYKGLDILLEAMPLVLSERPVHLLVAGEFWHGQQVYEAQIKRLQLGEAVTIINEYLPNETLAACIARADVVVLPYRSATQSAVVQAAFGMATPVITTDMGGLAEVVEDGQTGLIVPPENPEALAAAIDRFIGQDLGPHFKENIQQDKDRFSWRRLTELIDKLANQHY